MRGRSSEVETPPLAVVVLVVALGGVLGALMRYGIGQISPVGEGVPWSTFGINAAGCLLLGVLAVVLERRGGAEVTRAFLAVGVLGGFTTFSAVAGETLRLLQDGRPLLAMAYWTGTVVAALAATVVGMLGARRVLR
jgi:CrcB protein